MLNFVLPTNLDKSQNVLDYAVAKTACVFGKRRIQSPTISARGFSTQIVQNTIFQHSSISGYGNIDGLSPNFDQTSSEISSDPLGKEMGVLREFEVILEVGSCEAEWLLQVFAVSLFQANLERPSWPGRRSCSQTSFVRLSMIVAASDEDVRQLIYLWSQRDILSLFFLFE